MSPDPPFPLRCSRLVAWGNAVARGRTSLDEAAAAITGDDPPHRVDGLESGDDQTMTVTLGRLIGSGVRGFRLALPVPGDLTGLPGPADFNVEALSVGEAVLLEGRAFALVPSPFDDGDPESRAAVVGARVRWRLSPVNPTIPAVPQLSEAERDLAQAVRETTDLLSRLEVARLTDDAAEALGRLRAGAGRAMELAPGYSERAHHLLARATWLARLIDLAEVDDGAAISAAEVSARSLALRDVRRSARHAVVAAFNAPDEGSHGTLSGAQ